MATEPTPRSNRVTPFGEIEATPFRGSLMGNRGRLGPGGWSSSAWIACSLDYPRPPGWQPRYTRLFFHDEAVGLAAGFRPCAQCRRTAYARFKAAFQASHYMTDGVRAARIDREIREGWGGGQVRLESLPDGAFVRVVDNAVPHLKWRDYLHPWDHGGYGTPTATGQVEWALPITPASVIRALGAGYVPAVRFREPSPS